MTHDALLMSLNGQYRKILQIGTWFSHDDKPKGSMFKTESSLKDLAVNIQGQSHNSDKCPKLHKEHNGD